MRLKICVLGVQGLQSALWPCYRSGDRFEQTECCPMHDMTYGCETGLMSSNEVFWLLHLGSLDQVCCLQR